MLTSLYVMATPQSNMIDGMELLDEQIIYQNGSFVRVRRWFRGSHPSRGVLVCGYTGIETMEEKAVIRTLHTFTVL